MKYIILGKDNEEYGPVDQETLLKWVEHGRVSKTSKVRNALIKQWSDAGKLDFLEEAFKLQELNEDKEVASSSGRLKGLFGLNPKKVKQEPTSQGEKATAYVQRYSPMPASIFQRVAVFAIDGILISTVALILFFTMVIVTGTWVSVENQNFGEVASDVATEEAKIENEIDKNGETVDEEVKTQPEEPANIATFPPPKQMQVTFNFFFSVLAISILLYYGISLGIYAQTYGMWYWGVIIVKGDNDEAFPARTFAFAILSIIFAPITPIVVLLNPAHRSIHGYITGTRLIRITATSKM